MKEMGEGEGKKKEEITIRIKNPIAIINT